MAQKRRDVGRYGYRQLAADGGVSFGYARKLAAGIQHPSRQVVEALARALAPYLNEDEAMLAAGYVPRGVSASLLQRVIAAIRAGVAQDNALLDAIRADEARRAAGDGADSAPDTGSEEAYS